MPNLHHTAPARLVPQENRREAVFPERISWRNTGTGWDRLGGTSACREAKCTEPGQIAPRGPDFLSSAASAYSCSAQWQSYAMAVRRASAANEHEHEYEHEYEYEHDYEHEYEHEYE